MRGKPWPLFPLKPMISLSAGWRRSETYRRNIFISDIPRGRVCRLSVLGEGHVSSVEDKGNSIRLARQTERSLRSVAQALKCITALRGSFRADMDVWLRYCFSLLTHVNFFFQLKLYMCSHFSCFDLKPEVRARFLILDVF